MNIKYPRTPHLSYSEGRTSDDISFNGKFNGDIVITEKMDGECSGMTNEVCHARSLDSKYHISRKYLLKIWNKIRNDIPNNMKIFGECVSAKHSIYYNNLPDHFLVFGILENDNYLSWNEVVAYSNLLGLYTIPVLYIGKYESFRHEMIYPNKSVYGDIMEGYVIRNANNFHINDFSSNVAKYVRKNHVQTDKHWMFQEIVWNGVNYAKI